MDSDNYERELQRRLTIVEDPEYHDPARRDLPRADVVVLVIAIVVIVATMWLWGAPA